MLIRKTSGLTGKVHDRDIPVTQEQMNNWLSGVLIQDAMPNVSTEDREFLITGITPEEWKEHLG